MKALRLGLLIFCTVPACLPAQAQTGPGFALNFTATNSQYAQAPAKPSLTPSNYTFEAWVTPRTTYSCATILSRGDGGGGSDYIFEIGYNGTICNSSKLALWTAGAWNYSTNTVPTPGWAHVAVTYDGTTVRFYINGVLSGNSSPPGPLAKSGTDLFLGRQGTTCNCNLFDGSMDEVRIWSVVRTSAQIQQTMNQRLLGTETGLVAYYRMDEGSGTTVSDATGQGNTATFGTNAPSWASSGALFIPDPNTAAATAVTFTSATLNGTVNPGNLPTGAWFQWGATTNYASNTTVTNLGAANAIVSVNKALTGLSPATIYHFRAMATNSAGTNFGGDQSFTTAGARPAVTTLPANPVFITAATLNGTVNPGDLPTTAWFQWGTTTSYGSNTTATSLTATNAALSVSTPISGLSPFSPFHFRVVAANSAGTNFGGDVIFTTIGLALGAGSRLEGPAAGLDSVVLAAPTTWTATSNAPWLHLSAANQSGVGSTNVIFSFDANPGVTRTGTLIIAIAGLGGLGLTVTQAGSNYVAAGALTTLVGSGLNIPTRVALNSAGDVYIADSGNHAIKKWLKASNVVTTVVSSGLANPVSVTLDGAGNLYIADTVANTVFKWTGNSLTMLVSTGLSFPTDVAADGPGNVYIADRNSSTIKEWVSASSLLTTVVSSGLLQPYGVALDAANRVYIADTGHLAVKEWLAANNTLITLPTSALGPDAVAVDGGGNVYFADRYYNTINEWVAASNTVISLVSSGLNSSNGVAVDRAGDVYIADEYHNAIYELPRAFVDPRPRVEGVGGGTDALPAVLPATANLLPPFAPTSDQPWLTITGVTNGVVSFSFTTNTGPARSANITVLGQPIVVSQAGISPTTLFGTKILANGSFQFSFTNTPSASFTVLTTTNVGLPLLQWTPVGAPVENPPGQYQFTDTPAADARRFYILRSP